MSCIGFAGYLFIKRPLDLFLVQIIFGIGEAIGTPAFDGLYSRHLDKGKYVSEWGLWESLDYIVAGVAAVIGGFLAKIYGFKFLFIVMLILSFIGLIISLFLMREIKPVKKAKRRKKK